MAEPTSPPPKASGGKAAQILEALGPPPTATTGTDTRRPFGLPAETLAANAPGFVPYIEGDEWGPQSKSPADKRRLQLVMERAGLLSENGYSPAVWDGRSANAWKSVLELANSMATRDTEKALAEYATAAQTYGTAPKGARAPLVTRLADPEGVRQVIRDSSFKLLGRRLSASDEARLIASYQAESTAYQRAAYNAAEGGGTITEPDPEARLQARLEADYGSEVETQRAGSFLERITNLGPTVKRPTIQEG